MSLIKTIDRGLCSVRVTGKFTFQDNATFREILENIAEKSTEKVVFNMSDAEFVDSAALGMLLLARDAAINNQKKILIEGINGQVKKMFELAHFEQLFTIV